MDDKKSMVKNYARRRIEYLESETNRSLVRADLANLRRGIGKKPGELPELWELLFREFPEELMSSNAEPTWAEWAVSGALTLYALHMQGAGQTAHKEGQRLGIAIGRLTKNDADRLKAVQRRFNAFATSKSMPECMHHLRGLVQLLHSEDIPMDYVELAGDLYDFQTPDGAAKIRLRWGQDFYRNTILKEESEEKNNGK